MAVPKCTLLLLLAATTVLASPFLNETEPTVNWTDYQSVIMNVESLVPPQKVPTGISNRIIGGRPAPKGSFPWQAALFIDERALCGGSLISSTIVLTAAHCTFGARKVVVFLGVVDISLPQDSTRQSFQSTSIYNHPQYYAPNYDNDIAVVRLPSRASFNAYVQPIQLASSNVGSLVGFKGRATGWGRTSPTGSTSAILRYVDLPVISNTECSRYFIAINSAKLCVSTAGSLSTCHGDSGGPLVYWSNQGHFVQFGITSFGHIQGCLEGGAPAAFTRVSSYVDNFIRYYV